MHAGVSETLVKVKQILARMELTLNEEKSRVVDGRKEGFNFLGFTFCRKRNRQTGKDIILVEPSRKSQRYFREEVRHLTGRWSHGLAEEEVLGRVNRYDRGWENYFHLYNSTQAFRRQRFFLEQRMRKYLQKRRQRRGFGIKRWSTARLYRELGLCAIPLHASYRRTRMP
jgi:RNA-directed DNA polymerase